MTYKDYRGILDIYGKGWKVSLSGHPGMIPVEFREEDDGIIFTLVKVSHKAMFFEDMYQEKSWRGTRRPFLILREEGMMEFDFTGSSRDDKTIFLRTGRLFPYDCEENKLCT